MPKITYIDHDGTERTVEAKNGESVMEAAIKNSIPGIDADCGGACACATCHVYVDQSFMDKVGEQQEMEKSMLDFAENVQENSRLSCQITVSDELDGLRVTTPESQH
ncbi:2Fe-2S iron-sulfur cluster-binding protein [Hyphomonas sp.]|jgi:2Fe-2S ferredoxin|uniref:2Fe-2S iron-sulfur cluster-binding protein n=1 Tax=Hyphomonas sp. TaxID=87 RepID=UPI000C5B2EB6|nr:2Fe-2S iron-sulfur cluster-binding protein [Hyphomonas sp.]MAB11622.1 2Fe-2S ferredoxin [Hyphomonas sp.]MAU67032.1 2Fe-2S ferredoxin [Hyphomonas sp.]MBM57222.1 2Fe-2S ferredoxin [Hyphomonas sp.]